MAEERLLPARRIVLRVEYDGTAYRGLQWQATTSETIQQKIQDAARTLGSTETNFVAAGRTDTGVHALDQVIAVDLPARLSLERVALAMNALLPEDIRVREAALCPAGFSPRFDARRRTYVYRLSSRDLVTPILRRFVAYTPHVLNIPDTMAAARAFTGQWELKEWRSSKCQATRTLLRIDAAEAFPPEPPSGNPAEEPCPYWRFVISSRSFLHHQVRFMVGGIIAVGSGRLSLECLKDSLSNGIRPGKVKCEEACGLVLTQVGYPPEKDPFARERE